MEYDPWPGRAAAILFGALLAIVCLTAAFCDDPRGEGSDRAQSSAVSTR